MIINDCGYLARKTPCVGSKSPVNWRNWWLVKHNYSMASKRGYISLGNTLVSFPSKFIGKKIRLKVEVFDND